MIAHFQFVAGLPALSNFQGHTLSKVAWPALSQVEESKHEISFFQQSPSNSPTPALRACPSRCGLAIFARRVGSAVFLTLSLRSAESSRA